MGYMNRFGRRPPEFASKSAHTSVINDPDVQAFLSQCELPSDEVSADGFADLIHDVPYVDPTSITHIAAVDGGYSEAVVKPQHPSATICFFQFGALFFATKDLDSLDEKAFIDPSDMAKLKQIQRLKLALPIRNIRYGKETSLTHAVRRSLQDFLLKPLDGDSLASTLRWFLFQEYKGDQRLEEWTLASSPYGAESNISLRRDQLAADFSWEIDGKKIYIVDVLRLHERIDDELGAGGIQAYVTTAIEHLIVVHMIRLILATKPAILSQLLFIKDGPLAFFGVTARMQEPMRALIGHLFDNHNLFMAGLEKSGAFVEHAHQIKDMLAPGSVLVLNDDYIYKYIIPGKTDPNDPYGRTTYYGTKVIFRAKVGGVHVVTLPTREAMSAPKLELIPNIGGVLTQVEKLRCDMYDDALLPIALANKLVSLSNHPSAKLLQQFAAGTVPIG